MVLFSLKLAEGDRGVGALGIGMLFGWYGFSSVVLSFVSPSFGKMAAVTQQHEGLYRTCHTDILHHSEEIAFY